MDAQQALADLTEISSQIKYLACSALGHQNFPGVRSFADEIKTGDRR